MVTKINYPDCIDTTWDIVTLTYDLDGAPATRTAQRVIDNDTSNAITFDYDTTFRRLTKQRVTTPGTGVSDWCQSMQYTYDSLGRREKITSYSDNNTTTAVNEVLYEYNDLGALEKEYQEHESVKDANSLYVQYNFDDTAADGKYTKAMRLKSVRYPNARLVHMTYGAAGSLADKISRLDAIKDDNAGSPNNTLSAYSYNGAGRLVVEDYQQPDVRLDYWGQTADTYAGFDRFGRVTTQKWRDYTAGQDRDKYTYAYDRNSNRKYKENTLTAAKDELYSYDNLNRLTSYDRGDLNVGKTAIDNKVRNEAWTLSAVGNWTEYKIDANGDGDYGDGGDLDQDRTNNLVNEITDLSTTANDPTYDARGNMTQDEDKKYEFDAWNRLVKVRNRGDNSLIATYTYDGRNHRIRKVVEGEPDVTLDFYYNTRWQVLEIRKDSDTDPLKQYVWSARYIDAPVCRFRDSDTDGANIETLYYTNDANMNVTALVDSNGDAVERYIYDPYGNVTIFDGSWGSRQSSSYDNCIRYSGYRYDGETGLYHVRYRYYHPSLGRWLTRDPLGYWDSMSLYEYCVSEPVGWVDPLGESPAIHFFIGYDGGVDRAAKWLADKIFGEGTAKKIEKDPLAGVTHIGKKVKTGVIHVAKEADIAAGQVVRKAYLSAQIVLIGVPVSFGVAGNKALAWTSNQITHMPPAPGDPAIKSPSPWLDLGLLGAGFFAPLTDRWNDSADEIMDEWDKDLGDALNDLFETDRFSKPCPENGK